MKVIRKCIASLMCAAFVLMGFNAQPVKAAETDDLGVPIDAAHFPDDNFRECVAINSDSDGNGYLDYYEILYTWNLYCENSDVYSIEGVEYFPYLKGLWCKGNHITELDLSGNPDLEGVWCSFNDLTEIDFSPCPKLAWVYCFNCKLEKLDFTNNPKLAYLECNANPNLKEIDVSQNSELENLFCSECALTELDVSNNPLLCELTCFKNNLKSLDVSHNPLIKRLDIWWNEELGDVDVSHLKEMQYYNIGKTAAKHVNIKNNKNLLEFVCNYNDGVTSLDLSGNPNLTYLALECDTKLKSLDLSHNPKLYYLMAFGLSSIESIDLSKNYRLCKAYNEGEYVHETEKLGYVYSMTLDYGGSSDPFDELRHCVALDDRITGSKVNAKFNGKMVPDCTLDTNDGLSDKETFITRGQAIQTLYEIAGEPDVYTNTRFKDVPADASYYDAVRWGEANNICFGYPVLCDDVFDGEELINRQDWALMAHRFADLYKLGTALDYGRSDWYKDSLDMDFYSWAPFTWALQWKVVHIEDDATHCLPHGRITYKEFEDGLKNLMDIDVGATYAQRVGGNFGADGDPNATEKQGTGYINNQQPKDIKIVIPTTDPGSTKKKEPAGSKNDEPELPPVPIGDTTSSPSPSPSPAADSNDQSVSPTPSAQPTDAKDPYGNDIVPQQEKEEQITSLPDDNDTADSTFSLLQAKQAKVTKNSIKISWKQVKGADSYVIYGNKCGKKNKYVKIGTVTGNSFTAKKLKKGTYYKFIVVAEGGEKALATSKTLHIATKGGKVGNDKAVKVKKSKVTLKVGKSSKIKASAKAQSPILKVKRHRKLSYETSNPAVATVSSNGKIKAVGKGNCVVYVYAQNGIYKAVKVTVK